MREVKRITVGPIGFRAGWNDEDDSVTVVMEAGDYRTPDGYWHADGVYKVGAKLTATGKSHTRTKTFKGETAWMKAERLFDDIIANVQYGR